MRGWLGTLTVCSVCLSSPVLAQDATGALTGTVVDSANQPVGEVLVFVDEGPNSTTTGTVGAFRLEDVPAGTHLLNFRKAGFAPRSFNLALSPNEDRRDVGVIVLEAGPDPTATFTGTVTDGVSGRPIAGAVVELNGDVVTRTADNGVFLLWEVPISWGSNELNVGHIAFSDLAGEFWIVNPSETLDFSATLDPLPIEVGGVVAEVARTPSVPVRLQRFYDRLERGIGQYVTREEIEARDPPAITDVLRGVSGVTVAEGPYGREIYFRRRTITFRPGAARDQDPECASPLIFLDGSFVGGGGRPSFSNYINLDDLVDPDNLEGIEIYDGPARMPAQFNRTGSGCGVISLWTRIPGVSRPSPRTASRPSSTSRSRELVDGETIRVMASQSNEAGRRWTEGVLLRLTPDTLWYRSGGGVLQTSLGDARIERSTLRDHRWGGAQLGVLVGGSVGGFLAYRAFEPDLVPVECNSPQFLCPDPEAANSEIPFTPPEVSRPPEPRTR